MKIPNINQEEKCINKQEIIIPSLEKEYTYTQVMNYDSRFCSDNLTINFKIKVSKEMKQMKKDIKSLSKLLKRMMARGWKVKKDED